MIGSALPLRPAFTPCLLPAQSALSRRQLLRAALFGAPLSGGIGRGIAQSAATPAVRLSDDLPDRAQITVAGPDGGELDSWSRTLVPALGSFMPMTTPLRRGLAGGIDGVTGANQFAAQALPDGSGALLLPGSALLARLRGDPSAQFEPAQWLPLLAGLTTTVIAGRIPASQLQRGQKIRIGVSGPNGPELVALLGLEQLGLQPIAVGGLVDTASVQLAFAQHAIDLFVLRGAAIGPMLTATAARPICVLGVPDANGILTRDAALPEIPQLAELLGGITDNQPAFAWRGAAIAAQLAFMLVLPRLTPIGPTTLWRRAAAQASTTAELQAMATNHAVRLQAHPDAIYPILVADVTTAALRGWLAGRQQR